MGTTRDLFKKIRDTKGTFHAKMGKHMTEMVTEYYQNVRTDLTEILAKIL